MSRRRAYRQETLDTIQRFFEALTILKDKKLIGGYQTYCYKYEIDKRNFYNQKNDHNLGYFEVYWLIPLIKDFDVSPDWLLLGKGKMFNKKKKED